MIEKLFAFFLIIILFPILILLAIIILITSGRPILFKHKRYSYQFKEFNIIKFRTMIKNNGPSIALINDQRITPIGRVLRMGKLDELPQLFNIIRGEMTFIGPRPEAVDIVKKYVEEFNYLSDQKPGITDINSIIFKNEMELLNIDDPEKYYLEILPIKNQITKLTNQYQSSLNSIMLILLTIIALINHKLSLYIVSKNFLPYEEKDLRKTLNNLLTVQIF